LSSPAQSHRLGRFVVVSVAVVLAIVLSAGLAAAAGGWSAPKRLPKAAFTTTVVTRGLSAVSCATREFCVSLVGDTSIRR